MMVVILQPDRKMWVAVVIVIRMVIMVVLLIEATIITRR